MGRGHTSQGVPSTPNGKMPTHQVSAVLIKYAWDAISVLDDAGGFLPDTKAQFAFRLGWLIERPGSTDDANVRRVEDVCNLTRDLAYERDELLCLNVIEYAPGMGGMHLTDPTKGVETAHLLHALVGDLQRQQQAVTQNRRRQPMWEQAGNGFANEGEMEMARLMWEACHEIKTTGFVNTSTMGQVFKHARERGLLA
jgi:hypothetical protein